MSLQLNLKLQQSEKKMISLYLYKTDIDFLTKVANDHKTSLSDLVRHSLNNFIDSFTNEDNKQTNTENK